eukprot:2621167-Rhodomonas_salina.1
MSDVELAGEGGAEGGAEGGGEREDVRVWSHAFCTGMLLRVWYAYAPMRPVRDVLVLRRWLRCYGRLLVRRNLAGTNAFWCVWCYGRLVRGLMLEHVGELTRVRIRPVSCYEHATPCPVVRWALHLYCHRPIWTTSKVKVDFGSTPTIAEKRDLAVLSDSVNTRAPAPSDHAMRSRSACAAASGTERGKTPCLLSSGVGRKGVCGTPRGGVLPSVLCARYAVSRTEIEYWAKMCGTDMRGSRAAAPVHTEASRSEGSELDPEVCRNQAHFSARPVHFGPEQRSFPLDFPVWNRTRLSALPVHFVPDTALIPPRV